MGKTLGDLGWGGVFKFLQRRDVRSFVAIRLSLGGRELPELVQGEIIGIWWNRRGACK